MRMVVLVGVGLFTLGAVSATDEITVAVRLEPPSVKATAERVFRVGRGGILSVDARELGATVEGALVAINDPSGIDAQCRVQTQYETSATILSDVSHLNLLDGLHFTSEWADAGRAGKNRFRIPMLSAADRTRFPNVAAWELPQDIASGGGPGGAQPAGTADPAHDPRMAIDVSIIRVRVSCGAGATPGGFSTIEFHIPAGC